MSGHPAHKTQISAKRQQRDDIAVAWEHVLDPDAEHALLHAFEMMFLDQPTNPSKRQLDGMTFDDG
jgi:hypothetical protein